MNRKVRLAVLRILLLMEEFAPDELAEAASYIEERPIEDFLRCLSRKTSSKKSLVRRPVDSGLKRARGITPALEEIRAAYPERYQVLLELETAIRQRTVLRTLADFRTFGATLDKEFDPGKTRKEALDRLMALLAKMNLDAIRAVVGRLHLPENTEADSFRRLANQLISGQPERPAESA